MEQNPIKKVIFFERGKEGVTPGAAPSGRENSVSINPKLGTTWPERIVPF